MGLVVVRVRASELHAQRVDPRSERSQQGRQQGRGAEHRDDDGDRRREAELGHQRDPGKDEGAESDHHGRAREQDRPAGGCRGTRDRLLHLHAVSELQLVARDDEERVVDPHAQADHRGERRRRGRHVRELAEHADQCERADETEDRCDDRQRHRRRGAEGEQEDHDGGGQTDRLALVRARLRQLLTGVAAKRHVEAGAAGGIARVEHLLGLILREVALADVQRHRDVGDLLVLGEQRRSLVAERVDRPDHVGRVAQVLDRVVDRLLVARVRELSAMRLEDQRVAAVGLVRQALLEHVGGLRRSGSRERQVVAGAVAGRLTRKREARRGHDPDGDHEPVVAGAEPTEVVERTSHGILPSLALELAAARRTGQWEGPQGFPQGLPSTAPPA